MPATATTTTIKQVNPLAQAGLRPSIQTSNPHIPQENSPRDVTFLAYRHWVGDVLEHQHGFELANVISVMGHEIVNRDAQAYAMRCDPVDLTPSADDASPEERLYWPSKLFWDAVLATVEEVVQRVEKHSHSRIPFEARFRGMSDADIVVEYGKPKPAKTKRTERRNYLKWLVEKVGMPAREANVRLALCAIDRREPLISDVRRKLRAAMIPGDPTTNLGVNAVAWTLDGSSVIHRVLVDIRYPSAPDIASTTHDEPRRRNPNVMAPRYHYIGDTGVITYGKAAHTLARAFTEEYYRSGMLVPDAATTPNPDNSTQ